MKIGIVLQARMGSSRFPGKMLADLSGRPVLEWVFRRLIPLRDLIKILVTSDQPEDFPLAELAHIYGWKVLRGSEKDVLRRYAAAVKIFNLSTVVRITGDCPLIDPQLITFTLKIFKREQPDYLQLSWVIDGFDVGVISRKALLEADQKAFLPSEREHVTPYIRRFKRFRKLYPPYGEKDLSRYHLSLDYPEDLDLLREVVKIFEGREDFTYEEVATLLEMREDLKQAALRHEPNEGMKKSLGGDRRFIVTLKAPTRPLAKTVRLFEETQKRIPLVSQTYSKSYYMFSMGAAPLFVRRAWGCILEDVDGNLYTDYTMALGACILGYAFEPVNEAVSKQLEEGIVFTLPHTLEGEVAERLCELIPCAEMVRFGKNGSDVTAAAVRLARAYTGRDLVVCCGYHGWQDWYIGTTSKDAGVPEAVKELTLTFPYNDLKVLKQIFAENPGRIACVIMEPVILEEPVPEFLEGVRKICDREGAILVFDEVLTGFRFGLSGAQGRYGVVPDLACFGKALGNGFPISALVGRREIMQLLEHEVFFSFTFGGEAASLAAAKATIDYLQTNEISELLWRRGKQFMKALKSLIKEWELDDLLEVKGFPVRFVLNFRGKESLLAKTLVQQECIKRGELFTGAFNLALSHTEEIMEKTLEVLEEVLRLLRYAREYNLIAELLEGEPLREIFQVRK